VRAIVVDDSKPSRSILVRVLRDLRFDCTEATNGLEALAALSTSPRPDLVTINWHMPVMDGIELLKRLRAAPAHRDLKLLMVSTENDKDRIAAALAAEATCVVTYDRDLLDLGKPFGIEMVKLAEFLRRLPG
jgi:two-component system chemotaxis response regulator CheY